MIIYNDSALNVLVFEKYFRFNAPPNNSLDRSGGSVLLNLILPGKVE